MTSTFPKTIQDLKLQPGRFCVWMKVKGEQTDKKIPVDLDGDTFKGQKLVPGIPGTGTYKEALRAFKKLQRKAERYAGVGVILGEGICGIDLDEVYDGKDFHPVARELLDEAGTYAEVSPSQTGVKQLYTYEDVDLGRVPKTVYLEKKRPDGKRQAQIDPSVEKGRFFTLTEDTLVGLDSKLAGIGKVIPLLEKLAAEHGVKRGRPKKEKDDPGEGIDEDPPEWFSHLWQEDVPESVFTLASIDETFRELWIEGVKPDKGGDTSGSGLDWSLVQYLAPRIPARDLTTAMAHFPHGQVGAWINGDDDREDDIRRRMWRCISIQLAMIVTQDEPLARMFEIWAYAQYRWNFTTKTWFRWTGSHWKEDTGGLEPIRTFLDIYSSDRRRYWELMGKDGRTGLNKLKMANLAGNVEKLARAGQILKVFYEDFDREQTAINMPGGLLDAREFTWLSRDVRMCTRVTKCDPDWKAKGPWAEFLKEITQGNKELQRYLQQVAGVLALGTSVSRVMFFLYGPSSTGKSVFVETIARVLGSYSAPVSKKILRGDAHDEYVMKLRGLRMAMLDELGHTEVWDGATIKRLASDDEISSRPNYGRATEFLPTHTLIVRGNDQPTLVGADDAVARRVRLISFRNERAEKDQDENFTNKLVENHGGEVLAWILRGAKKYLRDGLQTPESVTAETREYVDESNVVARFIKTHVKVEQGMTTSRHRMVSAFGKFLQSEGLDKWTSSSVIQALRSRGVSGTHTVEKNLVYENTIIVELEQLRKRM